MRQIMTPNQKFVLVAIAIISIVSLSTVFLYTRAITPAGQAENFETFEEIDETYIYVDAQGNATCQFTALLPPSELADAMKSVVSQFGTSVINQTYSESIKSGWAQYGLETENITCAVTGLTEGDIFRL